MMFAKACLPWLTAAVLCGCALPPKTPGVSLPEQAPLSTTLPADGEWPQTRWWTRYQDATLEQLVDQALAAAPAIANAEARLQSARESVRLAAAANGLRVDAKADLSRQRLSDNGMFPPSWLGYHRYTQADLGLQASYTFDWWHKQRSAVEAAIDQARAAQAERSAAQLALAAAVCDTYFGWQADQARLALLDQRAELLERQRRVMAARIQAQLEPADGEYRLAGELAALRQREAALQGSARLRLVALAALLGRNPDELPPLEPKTLPAAQTKIPAEVRIGLIAQAVRQFRETQVQVAQFDALVQNRQAELARAQVDLQRREPLLEQQAIAPEEVRHAHTAVDVARAALEQAEHQAAAAHTLVDGTDARSNPAVLQTKNAYIDAWLAARRNVVLAPVTGQIARRSGRTLTCSLARFARAVVRLPPALVPGSS